MNLRVHTRKLWPGRPTCLITATAIGCLIGASVAAGQTPSGQKQPMAEDVFKNIQALRGISVDDFLGTMGIMSAAVGFDCSECHVGAGTDKVDWAFDTPRKIIARKMTKMVTTINHDNFGGRQMVTCWSCHRGRDRPAATPTFDIVYGSPRLDMDDVFYQAEGQPSPDQIFDKYIKAVGGAERLAKLTSFTANAKSVGFGGFGGKGTVQVYAKAPDQRATYIQFPDALERGDSIRTYNGSVGWVKTPLAVIEEYQLFGGDLEGSKLDAMLSFPGQIKQVLRNWRVGLPASIEDLPGPSSQTSQQGSSALATHEVVPVQGDGTKGLVATLYFDKDSGLLLRELRYSKSPIGRIPTQIDYADYRDVNGIKMPFRVTFAWLDGRDAFELTDLKQNVPVDESKFGRPPSSKP